MPKTASKSTNKLARYLPYILIILGVLGFVASFALTYDKIQVLKDPSYSPNCNINPILSCGSVMKTEQAELLGVPNTLFGIAGFTALITVGVLMLAGSRYKRWFWRVMQASITVALGFVIYLFYQGVYRINAVCPWCFLVWLVVSALFLYISLYNLNENNIRTPKRFTKIVQFAQAHSGDVLAVWYLFIIGLIINHFWYYWKTLI